MKLFNAGADAATAAALHGTGLEEVTGFAAAIYLGMLPCPRGTIMAQWHSTLAKLKTTKPDHSEAGCALWEAEALALLADQERAAKLRGERPEPATIERAIEGVSRFVMRVIELDAIAGSRCPS